MDVRDEEKSSIPSSLLIGVIVLFFLACSSMLLTSAVLPSLDQNNFLFVKTSFDLVKSNQVKQARIQEKQQKHNQTLSVYQEKLKLLRQSFEATNFLTPSPFSEVQQQQQQQQQQPLQQKSLSEQQQQQPQTQQPLTQPLQQQQQQQLAEQPLQEQSQQQESQIKTNSNILSSSFLVGSSPTPSENELLQKLLVQAKSECACEGNYLENTDFYGGDLKVAKATSKEGCCRDCMQDKECTRWTFARSVCYLKTDAAKATAADNLVSGTVPSACRPTPHPTTPPPPTSPTLPPTWPRVVVDGPKLCGALSGQQGFTCETTAVLILTYNRAEYLSQTLDSLFAAHPDPEVRNGKGKGSLFPIFVSQDGTDHAVTMFLNQHNSRLHHIKHKHFEERDVLDMVMVGKGGKKPKRWMYPYFALSMHYKKALTSVFTHPLGFRHVIVLEEDLPVAPDFFEYFLATGPLLYADPTLYCVSAWNDNGQATHAHDPSALHRTDMFPGLGWMLSSSLWEELRDAWPQQYWDDFLRHPKWRKERQCIRPEMSRTVHIGKKGGASKSLLKGKLGKNVFAVELTSQSVSFSQFDLSYLLQDAYETRFGALLRAAKLISVEEIETYANNAPSLLAQNQLFYMNLTGYKGLYPVKVKYDSLHMFAEIATKYGLMADEKAGVPRTAYKGVVQFRYVSEYELIVFLFPKEDFYQHCVKLETCEDEFFKPIPVSVDLSPLP